MFSPAFATAHENVALAIRRAAVSFWTSLRPRNRDITHHPRHFRWHCTSRVLLGVGTALYTSGEDDADIPELSVQLVTREGPSSEEFTEAALPQPAPDPVEDVVDDPGTSEQTDRRAARARLLAPNQDSSGVEAEASAPAAVAEVPPTTGPVVTTTGDIERHGGQSIAEPHEAPAGAGPGDRAGHAHEATCTQLAQKLLDTNMTNSELTWQQDGQQYSARVMRQPAADSTGLEQVIAEIMTNKNGKRMKTRLSLKRLAFSHFTQLVNLWDPKITPARRRDRRPFPQQYRDRPGLSPVASSRVSSAR